MRIALTSLLICSAAAIAATPQREKGGNLILTEGFEKGRDAWRPARGSLIDTERAYRGKASLKIVDRDNDAYFTTDCRLPLKPDSRYELSFWTFGISAGSATLCVIQLEENRNEAHFEGNRLVRHHFPFDGMGVDRWTPKRAVFTTGPTTAQCVLRLNPADGSRTHTGTAWFDDIALRCLGPGKLELPQTRKLPPVPSVPAAEESLPLKLLDPLVLDFGRPGCTILCPQVEPLPGVAARLAAAIGEVAGHQPAIGDDTSEPATLGRRPLIVMGNLATGAAARKLYLTGYDFTDYAWPGRGGHVVRTLRDPFGTGAHVLMVGGSYPEDVAAAATRAAEIIGERGPKLHYVNDVQLGENAETIEGWTSKFLSDDPKTWDRIGPLGSWTYMPQIGRAAMGYLRTGNADYLGHFKRELQLFFQNDVINRQHEAPSQIHSLVDALLVPWDLVADHPFFSPADRKDIDEKFLFLACSHEGPRPIRKARWDLRSNHGLGRALDAFWLGRYFWRRYGVEEGRAWMAIADNYFAPQMAASKTYEDNSYHQFHASLFCALAYALAAGKDEYLKSQALREAVERAIIAHPVGRGPSTYLSAYAVAADDPRYLSLMAHEGSKGYIEYCAGMRGASLLGEYLRSFCGFTTPKAREDLLGVAVAPLDSMWHERIGPRTNGGHYLLTTRAEDSFDKIAIRDGFQPDDFYLVVDGLCGGGHSFQDVNCIARYQDRGDSWLRQEYTNHGPTCSTVRQQNGVFVALNGRGPGAVHRCAKLLYARKLAEGYDAVGSALEGIGDVDWHRHILRKRGAWTLVIDRAVAKAAGEAFVERHWHVRGDVTATEDGLVTQRKTGCLHLQSAGLPTSCMSGQANRKEVVRAQLDAGGSIEIATILYVDNEPSKARYRLTQSGGGWKVSDGTDALHVTVQADGVVLGKADVAGDPPKQARMSLPFPGRQTAPSERGASAGGRAGRASGQQTAAPRKGSVRQSLVRGAGSPRSVGGVPSSDQGDWLLPLVPRVSPIELPWHIVELGDAVTAVAAGQDCVAAGTRGGSVAVVGLDARERWRAKVTSEVMSLHFVEGDLLVGEDNGTISRFDAAGKRRWSVTIPYVPISWPHWSDKRSRIHEITSADIDGDGEQEILLSNGDRRIYAFTGSGKQIWKRGVRWGIYSAMTPTTYEDRFALFGGARGPTLGGQLIIYGADSKRIGGLKCGKMESQKTYDLRLVDLNGDGRREIVCARSINSNQLIVCDEQRQPIWQADVAGAPNAIAIRDYGGERQILCASSCGYIHALNGATGERKWFCYLGDDAHFLWPRPDGGILALCPSGSVFSISAEGKPAGHQSLGGRITALLRRGEHRVAPCAILAGTEGGVLCVIETRAGR